MLFIFLKAIISNCEILASLADQISSYCFLPLFKRAAVNRYFSREQLLLFVFGYRALAKSSNSQHKTSTQCVYNV